jgi:hypothetical protein
MLKILAVALVLMICWPKTVRAAEPMSSAFTYQGHLYDNNDVANGLYDFQFKLYKYIAPPANDYIQVGNDVNRPDVDVIDSYFTVELDFGSEVFNGNARWLEIGVRPGGQGDPVSEYTPLTPLQEVTAAPYALQTRGIFVDDALNVGIGTNPPSTKLDVVGTVTATAFVGDGSALTGIAADSDWTVDGNDMYSIPSGNVGIGTSSPLSRLSAGGDGFVNTGVYGNGSDYGVYGNSSTYGVFGRGSYSGVHGRDDDSGSFGRLGYATYGVYGSGTVYGGYFLGKGYFNSDVGIGTTEPSSRLDIKAANQNSTGGLRLTSSINDNKVIHLQDSSPGDQGQISVRAGGSNKIVLRANGDSYFNGGNIGIGDSTPTGKLQVAGDEVRIGDGGTVNYVTGDGDLYVEDTLEVDGKIHAPNMSGCEYSDFPDYSNLPAAWTNVGSISLTLPEDGYIIVTFTGTAFIPSLGIAQIAIGITPTDIRQSTRCSSNNAINQYIPFCVQYTSYFNGVGGTITFYGNANSSGGASLENMQMTAIYVPKRY